MKSSTLIIIFISIFILTLCKVSYSQTKTPLSNLIIKDTILFPRGIIQNQFDSQDIKLEDIILINGFYYLNGYLIIQIDSNSYIRNFKNGIGNIVLKIFWVDSLKNIDDESHYYYYKTFWTEVAAGYMKYLNNERKNDFATFSFYLFNLNNNNLRKIDYSLSTYLYNNILNEELIDGHTLWERVDNQNIKYFIFKTSFYTGIFYNVQMKIKFLIPISRLQTFIPIDCVGILDNIFEEQKYFEKYFKKSSLMGLSLDRVNICK